MCAENGERPGGGPATILLWAAWIGLLASFLDLGLMIANRLIDGDFYRLGEHFRWIIPAGVTVLVLLPGTMLALLAGPCRARVQPGVLVGVLAFIGFLDVCARLPIDLWAALLLSGGLGAWSARLVGPRWHRLLKLVRFTAPLLLGILLLTLLGAIGGRAWSEYRAVTALPQPPAGARNLLLIVWDTASAGHLSLHGYERPTTPNLERLAGRGVRFDLAFATSSWTLPSHASLFTGRWPHELGVDWKSPLGSGAPTLSEYLGSRGYDTTGFVANLEYCSRETGLARGFAHYEDYPLSFYEAFTRYVGLGRRLELLTWASVLDGLLEKHTGRRFDLAPRSREHAKGSASLERSLLDWLSWQQWRDRPFFAFLNYNDAHSPYEVPDSSTAGFGLRPASSRDRLILNEWTGLDKSRLSYQDVKMAVDIYDDCIAHLDRRLGILLDELGRRRVLDNTVVIVASDHGEHLGDHLLFFHGCSLYRQLVQVPLVIVDRRRLPAGRVVAEPISLRDVPATAVDLLGLSSGNPFPGRSLGRFWNSDPMADSSRPIVDPLLMETGKPLLLTNQGREPAAKGPMKSLVAGGMHYIRSADGSEELYSLRSDPEERLNLAGSAPAREIVPRFRDLLAPMLRPRGRPEHGPTTAP
jgi:arylsulfatase A-like enzyme